MTTDFKIDLAMKYTNYLLFIFLGVYLLSCKVEVVEVEQPEQLRIEIAKSIVIPYKGGDTVIYDSLIGICGNSSKEELARYYEPHLDEYPYFDILKKNVKREILCTGDSLHHIMDRACKTQANNLTLWDYFSKNKVILSITGEIVSHISMKVFETYEYNGAFRNIEKLFKFSNDKWNYVIVRDTAKE